MTSCAIFSRLLIKITSKPSFATNVRSFGLRMDTTAKSSWKLAVKDLDPKQVEFYHSEQLIMVDDQDRVIGPISKGESHAIETVQRGIYHRALSLLVFDEQDRFLLTQRSSGKITFPNYFTNACCSHPLFNEPELEDDGQALGVKRATMRRSQFELGTKPDAFDIDDLNYVNRIIYRAESDGGCWGEAEVDYIFILRKNIELKPNPDEVQSYRYVTRSEMRYILDNPIQTKLKITPWVRLLSKELLFKYWDNLDRLGSIADPERIVDYKKLLTANQ